MSPAPNTAGHHIDRDELLARTDLAAVLDALTTGQGDGRRRSWRCPEPDHPDQHPSVTIHTDRHGVERWRCWSGGHGGTAIDAVIAARSLSVGDAIRWLNDHHAHLEPLPRPPQPESRPVGQPAPEVVEYVERCEKLLWSGSGRQIRSWLNRRGLTDDTLLANRVGADPGRRFLPRPRGLPSGWPAAVLPALDAKGRLAYFQARIIDPPEGRCKYDNPARRWATNPRLAWTRTSAGTTERPEVLVVAEGIPDALVAAQLGIRSVAVMGSTYPDERLAREVADVADGVGVTDIAVCFDADSSGRSGSARLAELIEKCSAADVREVCPPDGLDLTDWAAGDPSLALQIAPRPNIPSSDTSLMIPDLSM